MTGARGLFGAAVGCAVRRTTQLLALTVFGLLFFVVPSASGGAVGTRLEVLPAPRAPVELKDLRTATSRVIENPDGTQTAQVFGSPIYYQTGAGDWASIVDEFLPGQGAYAFESGPNSFKVELKSNAGGDFARLTSPDGRAYALGLVTQPSSLAPVEQTPLDGGLTYTGIAPGANLHYEPSSVGLKESIVLSRASAPVLYAFELTPAAGVALTAHEFDDGSWGLEQPDGSVAVRLAAPVAQESLEQHPKRGCAADPSGPTCGIHQLAAPPVDALSRLINRAPARDGLSAATTASAQPRMDVTADGDAFRIVISIDSAWLHDPLRAFPVVIDPTVLFGPPSADGYYDVTCGTCLPDLTSTRSHVGSNSVHNYIAISKWDLHTIPPASKVLSARLESTFDQCFPSAAYAPNGDYCSWTSPYQHMTIAAHRLTSGWTASTQEQYLTYDSTDLSPDEFTLGAPGAGIAPGAWLSWDLTGLVQDWVNHTYDNDGVMLQATEMCGLWNGSSCTGQNYVGVSLASSRYPGSPTHPHLDVTYTPNLGTDPSWPMWSAGPAAVNEASGNLVLAAPSPSFPTSAGTLRVPITFNSLDFGPIVRPLGAGWTVGPETWLIDHGAAGGTTTSVDQYFSDGSSVTYQQAGSSNVYLATDGSGSQIFKNPGSGNGYTAVQTDGTLATYGIANTTTGIANPISFETTRATAGVEQIVDAFDGSGRLQTVTAKSGSTTIATITLNWSCGSATLCVTGPDAVQWLYNVGSNGKLASVNDGTRTVMALAYDASDDVQYIYNADDEDPAHAGTGYQTTHRWEIQYDLAARVLNIDESAIRGQSAANSIWSFGYHPGTIATDATAVAHAGTTVGTQRPAAGYTTITPPCEQSTYGTTCAGRSGTAQEVAYYDGYGRILEHKELPDATSTVHHTLSQYSTEGKLLWTEDEAGNPADNTYDSVDGVLQTATEPDPDGAGSLPRPVTHYAYDETAYGSMSGTDYIPGTAMQGVQAYYYDSANFVTSTGSGRPNAIDTGVQSGTFGISWGAPGPPELSTSSSYSVRFVGDLNLSSAQTLLFRTDANGGTALIVDGQLLISNLSAIASQTIQTSTSVALAAGKHRLVLEYVEPTGGANGNVALQDCVSSGGSCSGSYANIAASQLTPAWTDRTSVATATGRVAFSHYDKPWTGNPDYSLIYAINSTPDKLITSYTYDTSGRITGKVLPNGNTAATISSGNLSGAGNPTTSNWGTTYSYYGPTTTATTTAISGQCSAATPPQLGLLQTVQQHGLHAVTTIYDSAGDVASASNAHGTIAVCHDAEGRPIASLAAGDSNPTLATYDPAGRLLTRTHTTGSDDTYGSMSWTYNEAGRVLDTVDANGAEATYAYDVDGNVTSRTSATAALSGATNYTTSYAYDNADQLVSQTAAGGSEYDFFYDSRGNLVGSQYPSHTAYSMTQINPDGWTTAICNHHGTYPTSPPSSGCASDDTNPISDYAYTYDPDGRRTHQTRTIGATTQGTDYYYDTVGRLVQVVLPSNTCRVYRYDSDSNRTTIIESPNPLCNSGFSTISTYTYAAGTNTPTDALTNQTGPSRTFGYDGGGTSLGDGEMTSRGSDTLSWDSSGRIQGATVSGKSACYRYDDTGIVTTRLYDSAGAGNCSGATSATTTKYLLGDLYETNGSGTLTASWDDGLAGNLASYTGAPTGTPTYLFYNGHGDLAAELDHTGAITTHDYDPFGAPLDAPTANATSHRYVGAWNKQYDSTSSLILMGARPYDPNTGRFLSVDPIDGGSFNNYDYAGQDPINGYDLSGTMRCVVCVSGNVQLINTGLSIGTTLLINTGGSSGTTSLINTGTAVGGGLLINTGLSRAGGLLINTGTSSGVTIVESTSIGDKIRATGAAIAAAVGLALPSSTPASKMLEGIAKGEAQAQTTRRKNEAATTRTSKNAPKKK